MRALLVLPLVALGACAADGTFKSPVEMTRAERCYNLELAYALAETNGAPASLLDRIRKNADLLCAPLADAKAADIAEEAQAEAEETVQP